MLVGVGICVRRKLAVEQTGRSDTQANQQNIRIARGKPVRGERVGQGLSEHDEGTGYYFSHLSSPRMATHDSFSSLENSNAVEPRAEATAPFRTIPTKLSNRADSLGEGVGRIGLVPLFGGSPRDPLDKRDCSRPPLPTAASK